MKLISLRIGTFVVVHRKVGDKLFGNISKIGYDYRNDNVVNFTVLSLITTSQQCFEWKKLKTFNLTQTRDHEKYVRLFHENIVKYCVEYFYHKN